MRSERMPVSMQYFRNPRHYFAHILNIIILSDVVILFNQAVTVAAAAGAAAKSIFQHFYFAVLRWWWCGVSFIAWTIPISVYTWRGNRKKNPFVTLQAKPFAFSRLSTLQHLKFYSIRYFPTFTFLRSPFQWCRELKCFQARFFFFKLLTNPDPFIHAVFQTTRI